MLSDQTGEELLEATVEREQRVTALELFFDLVFVLAMTQVTRFLYGDSSWLRLLEAVPGGGYSRLSSRACPSEHSPPPGGTPRTGTS
jgi:hypothetical protein